MKTTLLICQILIIAYITENKADSSTCTLGPVPISAKTMTGTIHSPGYPGQYYGNENCHWILHPPNSGGYDIIVVNIQFNIHPMNATEEHHCRYSRDYVDFGGVTGCGSEEWSCFVFLVTTSVSDNCHKMYMTNYGHCRHESVDEWPFVVSFHTGDQQYNAGFKMNYTFVPCAGNMNGPELSATEEIVKQPEPELVSLGTGDTTKVTTIRTQFSSLSNPEHSQLPDKGIIALAAVIAFLTIFTLVVVAATLRRRSRAKSRSQQTPSPENSSHNSDTKTIDDNFKKQALPLETLRNDEAVERGP